VAFVGLLGLARDLLVILVDRLVQQHVGHEEKPSFGVALPFSEGLVVAGQKGRPDHDLRVAAEARDRAEVA
jgi:hypothetical protein